MQRGKMVNYEEEYWCGFCGNKFKRGEEKYGKDANPRCPRDGHILRYIPRNKKER